MTTDAPAGEMTGTPVLPELDQLVHAPARLQLVTVLASHRDVPLAFSDLQRSLAITAGNLSTHLRKLEDAGYVAVTKAHRDRVPVTWIALTDLGRDRLDDYRRTMRAYLDGSVV
jgi:DNA-binding MarR family transcriptional regulator